MTAEQRSVTRRAYAKINLTLDILSRREDGYHDLAMVMQTIDLYDTVKVSLGEHEGIVCRVEGADLAGDGNNLAVKAAKAFCAATGAEEDGIEIVIEKRIPMAAGMAGGSADAAAVLRALNALLGPIAEDELYRVGALIGSDVPFCLLGGTAFAEGRGEKLTVLRSAPRLPLVVCKPAFPISTPVLFARADRVQLTKRPITETMLRAIADGDAAAMCANVANVFEEVLEEEREEVFSIKKELLACGAAAAQMTGSGPTVFGIFADEEAAQRAYETLRGRYAETFLTTFV